MHALRARSGGHATVAHLGGLFHLWICRPLSLLTGAIVILAIRARVSIPCSSDASRRDCLAHSARELGVWSLLLTSGWEFATEHTLQQNSHASRHLEFHDLPSRKELCWVWGGEAGGMGGAHIDMVCVRKFSLGRDF